MTILPITYAPHPIFKQKAQPITILDDNIRKIATDMLETMYAENAVGLGANMLGLDLQIIVLDLRENDIQKPYVMFNPQILEISKETNSYEEASISFPGISAAIERPSQIKVKYLDLDNNEQILSADGFLARVILHESDYLQGIVFLDYLSKMKRDILMKKMLKFIKNHPPHVHGAHCHH